MARRSSVTAIGCPPPGRTPYTSATRSVANHFAHPASRLQRRGIPPEVEIVAVGCRDISDAQASIVSPFTVSFIRGDTSNQIGCDVTCAGKDAKASWQLTDGDADGRR